MNEFKCWWWKKLLRLLLGVHLAITSSLNCIHYNSDSGRLFLGSWWTAIEDSKSAHESKSKANSSSLVGARNSETIAISSHKTIQLSDPAWTARIPSSQPLHRLMIHRFLIREKPSAPEAKRFALLVGQGTTWRLKWLCSFEFLSFWLIDSNGI